MTKFDASRWFLWSSLPFLAIQAVFSFLWHTPSVSVPIHDTYFVISNSQILFMIAIFFVFIAVVYWIMLKMNRRLHKGLSLIHYIVTVISIIILIVGMVISGFFTVSDSSDVKAVLFDHIKLKQAIAVSGFLLLFAQVLFIINCMSSLIKFRYK